MLFISFKTLMGFPHSSVSKESACNAEDLGLIPGSGRSPGEGNGYLLQYSCLGNPMDRGAWWATVQGVARVGHDLVLNHHQDNMNLSLFDSFTHILVKYFLSTMRWTPRDQGTSSDLLCAWIPRSWDLPGGAFYSGQNIGRLGLTYTHYWWYI